MEKTVFSDTPPLGTIVTAAFLNSIQNHRHDGLDKDGSCPVDYAADTGSANNYAVAFTPVLTAHIPGLLLTFKAAHANTGASTLTVNSLPAVAIKRKDGSALAAGDIPVGSMITVAYDGTYYQLLSSPVISSYYAPDTGSANAYAAAFTPELTAHVVGLALTFKAAHANTGASTLAVNSLAAVAIKRQDGSALQADDIPAGAMMTVAYDGTYYQVLNVANPNGACLLAENGYHWSGKKLEQWGAYIATLNETCEIAITFPAEFPNACFHIDISIIYAETGSLDWTLLVKRETISKTGVTIRVVKNGVNPDIGGFYWRAIGH